LSSRRGGHWQGRRRTLARRNHPHCARVCHACGAHRQAALIEEYLPGREFTTGVLGNGSRRARWAPWKSAFAPMPGHHIFISRQEECERLMEYAPLPRSPLRRQIERWRWPPTTRWNAATPRAWISGSTRRQPHFLEVNPCRLHPTHSDCP
jgi:D-alanine-D-alanine ligase